MKKRFKLNLSKRAKLELNITSLIFFIEIIVGVIIRIKALAIPSAQTIDHLVIAYLAFTAVLNISYGIILLIINLDHMKKSNADKLEEIENKLNEIIMNKQENTDNQEKIESKSSENNVDEQEKIESSDEIITNKPE